MRIFVTLCVSFSLVGAVSCVQAADDLLSDDNDRINYSVGYQVGSDFRVQEFELRPDAVLKGIEDALSGSPAALSRPERMEVMRELGKRVAERKQKMREQLAQAEAAKLDADKAFLKENAAKPGVVTTTSGLQYRIIEAGHGPKPGPTDRVMVHYRGRLVDGTEFDSSYKRNRPASFGVNQVIKGWSEALQLMPRGSKWELVIPAELGYGERGAGDRIPPNSTLIFDVYLVSIS